ncbi:hypothetical protein A0H81_00004 [Grifola frondosa]|uniref:Uncharacterized protein n=1 Tax=Grifola frondosa TaxID=5627 RepID=A0A1C7MP61_GRIFR|nr:hypothetical protein A0H81_00004 [Grifola frondosa]
MCAIEPWEYEKDYSPAWRHVVRHFRWKQELEELAKSYVRHTLQVPADAAIPPFITVHVRRRDFAGMCGNVPREECFAPLSVYARRVREVQEELRDLGVEATK